MKIFIYILSLLIAIHACKKSEKSSIPPSASDNSESGNLIFTIIDNQTKTPVNGAYVNITYGNMYSDAKTTGTDGKVDFSIPSGYVFNEVTVTKDGYCKYYAVPNTTNFVRNQTLYLDHIAYLRYHVKNVAPAEANDKMVIYSPHPTLGQGYEFDFYGAADETFITESKAGNLGISCNIFTGNTFVSSFYVNVFATGGDTTDVTVNY